MVSIYLSEIQKIQDSLNENVGSLSENDVNGIYNIHKTSFDEIMEILTDFRPLLSRVKAEYEALIGHVVRAQDHGRTVHEEVQTALSHPTTMHNYRRLCQDLRDSLTSQRRQNDQRMERLRDVRLKCSVLERAIQDLDCEDDAEDKEHRQGRGSRGRSERGARESRVLPNMRLTELTDLSTMRIHCEELEARRGQLLHAKTTKYVERQQEKSLSSQLNETVEREHSTRQEVANLIRQRFLLGAALTQARQHIGQVNLGEAVLRSLVTTSRQLFNDSSEMDPDTEIDAYFSASERSGPGSVRQSDYIVLGIRKFQTLMRNGDYIAAADLAVVVPRGVLRNYATLLQFKKVGQKALLYYCQILINTIPASHKEKLSPEISYECVDSALKEGRADLVSLWLSRDRLSRTELMADCLVGHADLSPDHRGCLDLAADIYQQLAAASSHHQDRARLVDSVLECLVKAGRVEEAVSMATAATTEGASASVQAVTTEAAVGTETQPLLYAEADFVLLLRCHPSLPLLRCLTGRGLCSERTGIEAVLGNTAVLAQWLVHRLETGAGVADLVTVLVDAAPPAGIDTAVWEDMLNFVDGGPRDRMIMELASSYLVQAAIERSCRLLHDNGWL